MTRAASGKGLDQVTLTEVLAGQVRMSDVSIGAETLEAQALVAERNGNPQLGANLRRAAELTVFDDDRVLEIYEALRPGRSSGGELDALRSDLEARGAHRCAALVGEAREEYARRGLLR